MTKRMLVFIVIWLVSLSGQEALAQTTSSYDGVYKGSVTLSRNQNNYRTCLGGPYQKTITVINGKFTFAYNPTFNGYVPGVVASDGTVTGLGNSNAGGTRITGKIQGGTFNGEIGSSDCGYSLVMTKVK